MIDVWEAAQKLHVVDVWQQGNETGWVTPPVLYDPNVHYNGVSMAPSAVPPTRWLDHATVGTNTLQFWGQGGSIANGEFTLAHYLVPHESTAYADRKQHDTTWTVFKMVKNGYACNHTGLCAGGIGNRNALGCEYENLQNGVQVFSDLQYMKGALIYTHDAAMHGIKDAFRTSHGLVAGDIARDSSGIYYWKYGRRTDPYAGPFDFAYSWELVQAIRREKRIWQFWNLPQPAVHAL